MDRRIEDRFLRIESLLDELVARLEKLEAAREEEYREFEEEE